jgi:hypothetical protein
MQVTIELPETVASLLPRDGESISRAVLEAILVTAICDAKISRARARQILGVSRYEMDGLLKRHGAGLDITVDSLEQDTAAALAFSDE